MADDCDDLVDLSVNESTEDNSSLVALQIHRSTADERWGFLFYNNRFPLTVGRVDNPTVTHLLFKGDVVVGINGVMVESFEQGATMMRGAGLTLTLTIDCRHSVLRGEPQQPQQPPSLAQSLTAVAKDAPAPMRPIASPFTFGKESHGDGHPAARTTAPTLRVVPVAMIPSRSNIDILLNRLPKPPRVATYSQQGCPFTEKEGFTAGFHEWLKDFMTEEAFAEPRNDLRFDAISTVMRKGIARLPNELIRDITHRGSDAARKQEATHVTVVDRERFMTQTNSMCSIVMLKKRERQGAEEDRVANDRATMGKIKEKLHMYQRLCTEVDDAAFVGTSSSMGGGGGTSSTFTDLPQAPSSSSASSQSFLPTGPALQQMVARVIAALPIAPQLKQQAGVTVPGELLDASATDVVHKPRLSKSSKKRQRLAQLKDRLTATIAASRDPILMQHAEDAGIVIPPLVGPPAGLAAGNASSSSMSVQTTACAETAGIDLPLPPTVLSGPGTTVPS